LRKSTQKDKSDFHETNQSNTLNSTAFITIKFQ